MLASGQKDILATLKKAVPASGYKDVLAYGEKIHDCLWRKRYTCLWSDLEK